jgi:hypothetical protein
VNRSLRASRIYRFVRRSEESSVRLLRGPVAGGQDPHADSGSSARPHSSTRVMHPLGRAESLRLLSRRTSTTLETED